MTSEGKLPVFALIGAGRMGEIHFTTLVTSGRAQVKWVVERDLEVGRRVVAKHRLEQTTKVITCEDIEQVFQDPGVDCIVVCSMSPTHEEYTRRGIAANKAVFCEKPLAETGSAAQKLFDEANSQGVYLFCGFQKTYDPQIQELHRRIQAGEVGKVRMVKTTSRDPPALVYKEFLIAGGGIVKDTGVHDIDVACFLVGEYPLSVYATGHATNPLYAECDDVDSCAIVLRFPGGAIGMIEVARDANAGYDQRVEVLGTKGMLQSENKRPLEIRKTTPEGISEPPYLDSFVDRYLESYRMEMVHFLDVIEGKKAKEEGVPKPVMLTKLVHACKESFRTENVVKL